MKIFTAIVLLISVLTVATAAVERFPGCMNKHARYKIIFMNTLTNNRFPETPGAGLVYSPLVAISHNHRQSFLTIRGKASPEIEQIAEQGINTKLIDLAKKLRRMNRGVRTVTAARGPTMPGKRTTLYVNVNCKHPFITTVGMLAPSPDWIVQINNVQLFNVRRGRFIYKRTGRLIAYDSGVDDGREFTPPLDLSLDMPTVPQKNIAPLVEDSTDRFNGRIVGRYIIRRPFMGSERFGQYGCAERAGK